jgi:type 1 glutamine amidotransferase
MQQWPKSFVLKDEIYQVKEFSRDKVRVLMRLDASKLDLNNPRVHRKDLDFAVAWAKLYGKGRVFYSTLGHVEQNWDDPRMQKMYVEAIRWAMGLVDADVTPRPLPSPSGDAHSDSVRNGALSGAREGYKEAPPGAHLKAAFSRMYE